jgi:tripartite ATP-independent transporter DctM subunit
MTSLTPFVVLFGLFLINTPIAVAVGAAAVIAVALAGGFDLMIVVQKMYAATDSFQLLAVPLFMIAGRIMEAGGISQRIVTFADSIFGGLPGGSSLVVIFSSMLFAGISGSAAADTAAVGGILIPALIARGRSPEKAAAVQAAAGSMGIIIPPSIPLILFGFLSGAGIGSLFAAGLIPGLMAGLGMACVAMLQAKAGGLAVSESTHKRLPVTTALRKALWGLAAPAIILGGIFGGIFTAAESAGIAVVYAVFVGRFIYGELRLRDLPRLLTEASITSATVMFIIASASALGWFMAVERIPEALAALLAPLADNRVLLLLAVNALLLIAGSFIETTAALMLFTPVLLPLLPVLGMDIVQLGVVIVFNLAIGMLTPPLGICLIVAGGIARSSAAATALRALPYVLVLIINLLIITFWSTPTMLLVSQTP